ncbi:UDP-N-acetylmuramoyl-L-alanine--D-glutamate ligase [bacterium]|nr:UDP-N-acetylmuramoyl-L-alanine--D-glutamate ligase [bacterium]
MDLTGKKVLVAGFARTGQAVVDFLRDFQCEVAVSETRDAAAFEDLSKRYPRVEFELGGHTTKTFVTADIIVLSPGIPSTIEPLVAAKEAGIPILAEIELAYRFLKGTLIGITGTNGKSTTTKLAGAMLQEAGKRAFICGNIGTPLIQFCKESRTDDYYVAEISSFQLETIHQFRPHISALINLAEDHLDWYPSVAPYYHAKMRMFENQTKTNFAVLNYDDPYIRDHAEKIQAHHFWFSRKEIPPSGVFAKNGLIRVVSGMPVLNFNLGALKGVHNLENSLCAASIALLCAVLPKQMQKAAEEFRSLPHRMEDVGEVGGVHYYDDSKATNVDAVLKSLESFPGNIFLIMGGKDKGCDYRVLRDLVRNRVKSLLLIGEAAQRIASDLRDVREPVFCSSLQEAVQRAAAQAEAGDVVLLSPACSSFDMFTDYAERGNVFRQAVQDLNAEAQGRREKK